MNAKRTNANEVVQALELCTKEQPKCHICPLGAYCVENGGIKLLAAKIIKYLQSKVKRLEMCNTPIAVELLRCFNEYDSKIFNLTTDLTTKTTLLDAAIAGQNTLCGEIKRQDETIARLTAERDAAQRREQDAVSDLCDCCKRYAKCVMLPTDCLDCKRSDVVGEGEKV